MLKAALPLAFAVFSFAAPAAALDLSVQPCEEANIGITSLVTPVADNVREFADEKEKDGPSVTVYNVDTIEPAAYSAGLAFVLAEIESPLGDNKCLAIIHLSGTDITKAKSTIDAKGVHLEIPQDEYDNETGTSKPTAPLKVRVDLKASTVEIE